MSIRELQVIVAPHRRPAAIPERPAGAAIDCGRATHIFVVAQHHDAIPIASQQIAGWLVGSVVQLVDSYTLDQISGKHVSSACFVQKARSWTTMTTPPIGLVISDI
jgi:hypothetical protein